MADDPRVWDVLRADLHRYGEEVSLPAMVKCYLSTPGFRYVFWMRLAWHIRAKGMLWRVWYYFCRVQLNSLGVKYGISIPYNARVGAGLYIGHYGGIVVNDRVVIGRDCNINHGVTIGEKYGGKNPGVPSIGDRVYLGPGSTIIGGIRLGNDVAVGANAVVVASVPDSGVVAGVPARLLSTTGSSDYVVNTERDRSGTC
jgi:serine O-acetyltransferase